MSTVRKLVFQPDILEWIAQQRVPVATLRKYHYKNQKGFVAYGKDFIGLIRRKKDPVDDKPEVQVADASSVKAMDQLYEAQDLTKRMKWKRVTWDDDADYATFAKRVLDNDVMFKRTPAFSFLTITVVKDPTTSDLVNLPAGEKLVEPGTLTNWLLQERVIKDVALYPVRTADEQHVAFNVDWTSGSVKILDTASAQEILTFLSTVAPRLQAVQVRMEEQQTKQIADVEYVRVRVGATLKFNRYNTSFWDDPQRKTNPDFVNPDELDQFLKGMLQSAFLYRWFLKGQEIRVVPPSRPYYIDLEKKEVQIPANFAEYNWLKAHPRFEALERIADSFRRFWWLWFCAGIVLVGDVDVL